MYIMSVLRGNAAGTFDWACRAPSSMGTALFCPCLCALRSLAYTALIVRDTHPQPETLSHAHEPLTELPTPRAPSALRLPSRRPRQVVHTSFRRAALSGLAIEGREQHNFAPAQRAARLTLLLSAACRAASACLGELACSLPTLKTAPQQGCSFSRPHTVSPSFGAPPPYRAGMGTLGALGCIALGAAAGRQQPASTSGRSPAAAMLERSAPRGLVSEWLAADIKVVQLLRLRSCAKQRSKGGWARLHAVRPLTHQPPPLPRSCAPLAHTARSSSSTCSPRGASSSACGRPRRPAGRGAATACSSRAAKRRPPPTQTTRQKRATLLCCSGPSKASCCLRRSTTCLAIRAT